MWELCPTIFTYMFQCFFGVFLEDNIVLICIPPAQTPQYNGSL